MNIETLKFPIGKYSKPATITPALLTEWIATLAALPSSLSNEVTNLTNEQLDTHYRPDGWTIRQVVHHLADSHMNAFIRFKLALTEETPTVKPYLEASWAELPDSSMPIESSLQIITGIHARWVNLLRTFSDEDLSRTFIHPEHGKIFRLDEIIGLYAWHSNHHLAHITTLKERNGWK
ncbi:MAG: putative metal-dependent hydrolase [Bacteroidota bacterium]